MIVRMRRGNNAWSPLHRALRIAALEAALQEDAELAGSRLVLVAQAGVWSFVDRDDPPAVSSGSSRPDRRSIEAAVPASR